MDTIKTIYEFSRGRKTFVVGILMITLGYMTDNTQMILEGIGFITLRLAVK